MTLKKRAGIHVLVPHLKKAWNMLKYNQVCINAVATYSIMVTHKLCEVKVGGIGFCLTLVVTDVIHVNSYYFIKLETRRICTAV